MKNPFKTQGFDTVIGKDTTLVGELCFSGVTVVDGSINGTSIKQNAVEPKKSALIVNGTVDVKEVIITDDLTISGSVKACTVRVRGTLAIRSGCVLQATTIYYQNLVAEPGAVILGEMRHFDHSSGPLEV
jgi:cytoskeletal protein CcmA (bactofilin family)